MRFFCFSLLLFVGLSTFVSAAAQDTSANKVDPNKIQVILDAIEHNRSQIDSFEAVFTLNTMATFLFENKPLKENQTTTIHYWSEKNGKKWRCETETRLFLYRDGKRHELPYKSYSVHDGNETRFLREDHSVGEIDGGNTAKENSDIVNMANRFSNKDIVERIKQADTIETEMMNGKPLVKIVIVNSNHGFTDKIWLNPAKGYNLERAEFWVGERLGELQIAEMISKFGNAWIVTDLRNEQYKAGELLHQKSLHIDFVNYGKPISAEIFNLEFPPETYVTDNIEGKEYQVPHAFESNQAGTNSRWIVWALINIVILGILIWSWLIRKKRHKS